MPQQKPAYRISRGWTFWGKTFLLFIFWLMITWSFDLQHLLSGAVIAVLVAAFYENFLLKPAERPHLNPVDLYYMLIFIAVFIWEMIKANVKVAYIVLHPRLPIAPGTMQFRTRLKTDLGRVIFANAITLTPGSLTVELEGDLLTIHGLTSEDLHAVQNHPLERILLKIEEE